MTTKLFTTLAAILACGTDVTIVTRKNGEKLIVSVSFRNDNVTDTAKELIAPFVVSGTPEELDAEFIEAIKQPLEQSAGLQTSMANFEAQKKIAEANSKAAAEAKKKEETEKKAAQDKVKKLLDEAAKAKAAKNWKKAITLLTEAKALAPESDKAKIGKELDECREKSTVISMFDDFDNDDTAAETNAEPEDETPSDDEPVDDENENEDEIPEETEE